MYDNLLQHTMICYNLLFILHGRALISIVASAVEAVLLPLLLSLPPLPTAVSTPTATAIAMVCSWV